MAAIHPIRQSTNLLVLFLRWRWQRLATLFMLLLLLLLLLLQLLLLPRPIAKSWEPSPCAQDWLRLTLLLLLRRWWRRRCHRCNWWRRLHCLHSSTAGIAAELVLQRPLLGQAGLLTLGQSCPLLLVGAACRVQV